MSNLKLLLKYKKQIMSLKIENILYVPISNLIFFLILLEKKTIILKLLVLTSVVVGVVIF